MLFTVKPTKSTKIVIEAAKTLFEYRFQTVFDIYRHHNPVKSTQIVKSKLKEILLIGKSKVEAKEKFNVLEVRSLKYLKQIRKHRKMRVFFHKGCVCRSCGAQGLLLINRQKGENNSWTVVTKDLVEMNVDHIIPKSRGGSNGLPNLQPMCVPCNSAKKNSASDLVRVSQTDVKAGDPVFVKKFGKFSPVGKVLHMGKGKVRTSCSSKSPFYKPWYSPMELYKVIV